MTYRLISFIFIILGFPLEPMAEKPFQLYGSLNGRNSGIVYLKYYKDGVLVFDSSNLQKNRFFFHGTLNEPNLASLSFRADSKSVRSDLYADFYLEPSEMRIDVTWNDQSKTKLTGSATNTDYQLLKKESDQLVTDIYRLRQEVSSGLNKTDSLELCRIRARQILGGFIQQHPLSNASVTAMIRLIQSQEVSPDSALILLHSLHPTVQASAYCQKAILDFETVVRSAVGREAPVFQRTDINGNKFSLADLKGKVVLLEYWASWCAPCRAMTPTIKEYYNKYHNKGLEIVFISCDSRYEAWRKAVVEDKIESFIHILSFQNDDMEFLKTNSNPMQASFKGELRKMYNLMPIPAEILIDREGKIIGRYGGLDGVATEKLAPKLLSLFESDDRNQKANNNH